MPRLARITCLALLCAACAPARGTRPPPSPASTSSADGGAAVTQLADEIVGAYQERYPEYTLFFGLQDVRPDALTDNSATALEAWQRREDAWAARLAAFDAAALAGTAEGVTLGFMRQLVGASRGMRACRMELWRVSEIEGWQATYAELAPLQPVGTDSLRARALRRWSRLPQLVYDEIANLRRGMQTGYTAPRGNVQRVLAQLGPMADSAAAASPFYAPAARDSSPAFRAAWTRLVDAELAPAARRYRDFLRDELLPAARDRIAVTELPDGRACYRAALRAQTTVDRDPATLFAETVAEVERREGEIRQVARRMTGTDDLRALYRWIDTAAVNRVASREQVLEIASAAVRRAEAAAPRWFATLPRTPVAIEPFPPHMEGIGSRGRYVQAPPDGSRPGTFLINLSPAAQTGRHGIETLVFHETLPGHHLQLSLAQEREGLHPVALLVNNAGFSEGWGRYAETLADEMGVYASEVDRLGLLLDLPTVAVVDLGIHAMGWTREQALDYLRARHPQVPVERLQAGVDRIAIWPAQALAYSVGADELRRLRAEAERALGPAFDVRAFHTQVLEDGTVTLPMVRERVERWIASQPSRP